ncbi:MAG: symmetrical bis(5'-nucleosyl)-tetraphosphatase [Burkholderiales bacterium]|jgi:bis(5'-nucleosyl)-tetraphosphatase (symmetrical)|nr:symmetrical bis(5'-nucleosyl)-tetraphosphatase [Burkholderiales bacterium]
MAIYLIGDLQGCDQAFARLLDFIAFDPGRDRLVVLGDAVNRGPDSLAVLRRLMALGDAAQCLLGNHDLHLLAVAHGVRKAHRTDTLQPILDAPDRDELLDQVRHWPLALLEHGWLLVHAGVLPQWTCEQTLQLASEVQEQLRGHDLAGFLRQVFGNLPDRWSDMLRGPERWRITINALTRLRFIDTSVHASGSIDFHFKQEVDRAPPGLVPWFHAPGRRTEKTPIAFGHWSSLGLHWSNNALCLDSGCLWGGNLTTIQLPAVGENWLQTRAVPCPREGKLPPP